jgi:hypothetical protein
MLAARIHDYGGPEVLVMEEAASAPMGATMAWAAVIETANVEEG